MWGEGWPSPFFEVRNHVRGFMGWGLGIEGSNHFLRKLPV
jgi:hypothetical protein